MRVLLIGGNAERPGRVVAAAPKPHADLQAVLAIFRDVGPTPKRIYCAGDSRGK
jgi:hypothetical protein